MGLGGKTLLATNPRTGHTISVDCGLAIELDARIVNERGKTLSSFRRSRSGPR